MLVRTPIKTRRLCLKLQSLNDFDGYFAMSKDPLVMRYIGDGSVFHWTRAVAMEKFKAQLGIQAGSELGALAVYTRDSQRYLGWCAVAPSRFLDDIELGYRYCRAAWGCGYATEAAAALLGEVYRASHFSRILACAHPQNTASIKVLHKLGFSLAYTRPSRAAGGHIPVYCIDRDTFCPSL